MEENDTRNGLEEAARVAMEDVIEVKEGERVLIVTNRSSDVHDISNALFEASAALGAEPVVMIQPTKSQLDFASREVLAAIRSEPDVIISISEEKLGKDINAIREPIVAGGKRYDHHFNYMLGEKKARSFWSPSVTRDIFVRTVPIDYQVLSKDCSFLKDVLDRGEKVRIQAPSGTDIKIGIRDREAMTDDGNFSEPGSGGNLPAGETFISPELGSSDGTIVFDGSIASDRGIIIIEEPIECMVKNGLVENIRGGREARELEDTISRARKTTERFVDEEKIPADQLNHYRTNTKNLGELGIGLNRSAGITGNMLEDEKVYGTCHIAIGANYDEDARALIHLDGLIKDPTITVMGEGWEKTVMEKGRLLH